MLPRVLARPIATRSEQTERDSPTHVSVNIFVPATDIIETLSKTAHRAAMRLNVRSAVNPCLWLCGIISVPAIGSACVLTGPPQVAALGIAAFPLLIFSIGFIYFMLRDPDKLQSESYQIQKRALELISQKGRSIRISPTSIEAITNPAYKEIADRDSET
jgi:hypothetical protein